MKTGIVTFHRALNYGAVLQAYALNKFLIDNGVQSEIIDYRSADMEYFYKPIKANPIKKPKAFLKELFYYPRLKRKRKKFESFIKKFVKVSNIYTNHEELKSIEAEYDCFISGSDQVWNFKWSNMDSAFFLDFTSDKKKNSYAASFGFSVLPDEYKNEYKKYLSGFNRISVRERDGIDIIDALLDEKEAIVSIDPTCLLSIDEWSSVAKLPNKSGYVLLYLLEKSEYLINFAKELAKKSNTEVIFINDAVKKMSGLEYRSFIGPDEFVGLFKNAKYIVTNSFHGLMFSVIFEKELYIMYQQYSGAPNSRLINFVEEYGLQNRVLTDSQPVFFENIDYHNIKLAVSKHIKESYEYIMELKNEYDEK